jgi:DNA repair photolyase
MFAEPWTHQGSAWVRSTDSRALLSPQSSASFLSDFDFALNPLAGCPFACRDCYVPDLGSVRFRRDALPDGRPTNNVSTWGDWIEVRTQSLAVLRAALDRGTLAGTRLFLSPLSDVYWPGERTWRLTRGLLELLAARPVFDWLLISTRSDLVLRDLDVLQQLGDKVEIGISIPSDRDDVKRALGSRNPSVARRFEAVRALSVAGVPVRIQVSPLAPYSDEFAPKLADSVNWVWVDWHAHVGAGFGSVFAAHGWQPSSPEDVATFARDLRERIGAERVQVGQHHFADRWAWLRGVRSA